MITRIDSKYIRESGEISKAAYQDGQLALMFSPESGEPAFALSTNLASHGLYAPEGHVYVKGYGEHEGVATALAGAGVASPVNEVAFGPYDTTATLMRVLID